MKIINLITFENQLVLSFAIAFAMFNYETIVALFYSYKEKVTQLLNKAIKNRTSKNVGGNRAAPGVPTNYGRAKRSGRNPATGS